VNSTNRPLLLCYDGSDPSKHAIASAPALAAPSKAIVLTVWQSITSMPSVAWGPGGMSGVDVEEIDSAVRSRAQELAEEGARLARDAGLDAEGFTVESDGPVWAAIIRVADERDAAPIVLGSRGLTGMRHVLLGSVSEGVVRRAKRPTLVIPPASDV
jgi:nucleotide-binding universal stress UspA family protein